MMSEGEIQPPAQGEKETEPRTAEKDTTECDEAAVDPWATSTLVPTDDSNEEKMGSQKTLSERWGSFQTRMQTQWQNRKAAAHNQDEAGVEVTRADDSNVSSSTKQERQGLSRFMPKASTEIDPSKMTTDDMASFRASKISVTLQKEAKDSKWGFGLEQKKEKVHIGVMAGMGLLEHAPFQVGDFLVAVNNQKCENAETTINELVDTDGGVPITLLVETPQGNPSLVQAMVRKSSAEAHLGIGFYVPADLQEEDIQIEVLTDESTTTTSGSDGKQADSPEQQLAKPELPVEPEGVKSTSFVQDDPTSQLLKINNIDASGLLAHSALSQGDIVVAINATPCSQMKPEEAEKLLLQSDDTVTITAMKPPADAGNRMQRWLRQAKRAGIAIGGGTMVGIGLVFIPTLPPPFGEVLIIGGVSVLGTEFEAPKRVMKSARDRLEKAVGREEEEKKTEEDEELVESKSGDEPATDEEDTTTTGTDDDNAGNQRPKKTMGDRFKNFGRRHVLPFLDQVVGDRKDEKDEKGGESPDVDSEKKPASVDEGSEDPKAPGDVSEANTSATQEAETPAPNKESESASE